MGCPGFARASARSPAPINMWQGANDDRAGRGAVDRSVQREVVAWCAAHREGWASDAQQLQVQRADTDTTVSVLPTPALEASKLGVLRYSTGRSL